MEIEQDLKQDNNCSSTQSQYRSLSNSYKIIDGINKNNSEEIEHVRYGTLLRFYLDSTPNTYSGISSKHGDLLEIYRYLLESLSCCKNLHEAISKFKNFYDAFSLSSRIEVETHDELITLYFINSVSKKFFNIQQQTIISANIMIAVKRLFDWLINCPITIRHASINTLQDEDIKPFEKLFDCPLLIDINTPSFSISRSYGYFPIDGSQLSIDDFVNKAPHYLFHCKKTQSRKEQVIDIISSRLYCDLPTLDELAATLRISKSKLYADLKNEGANYISLKNSHITTLSIDYISTTNDKPAKISRKLGFSSPGSFYRFFKDSTGYTPSEYRRSIVKEKLKKNG